MKVVVFGSTGTVGKIAVEKLLEEGHEVTAFARSPHKLALSGSRLKLQIGDALSPRDVNKAVAGQDAVLIVLGSGMARKSVIRSQGTLNVINAMQAHGVSRLICQSTLGVGETWSNLNFFWKRIMFGALLRPVFRDHELQEQLVRASGLDWTIVRPGAFDDKVAKGKFHENFGPNFRDLTLKIARSDVASFLTRQISDMRYLGKAVSISN